MKYFITMIMINALILNANAGIVVPPVDPAVNDTFNYQGELFDGVNPADGQYDFSIQAWSLATGGIVIGSPATFNKVLVTNGIFTLENIDLGDITDGYNIYFEIKVRPSTLGASFETLAPRQQLKAVPYATTLTSGNAAIDQVLTYDGNTWVPQTPGASSPWSKNGSNISYASGNVGIGFNAPTSPLHVKSNAVIPVTIDGGVNTTTIFSEAGNLRGFVGSGASIPDADFSIGSLGANMHILTAGLSRVTVTSDGDVGINTDTPFADLHVEGTTGGDLFRVRIDGVTKLHVRDNGGTSIGAFKTPPANGLVVAGDIQQPVTSNGGMKYMASVTGCGGVGVSLSKSFIGGETVGTGIQVQNDAGGIGSCEILFPENIQTRYIQATVIGGVAAVGKSVTCNNNGMFVTCVIFNTTTATETPGDIDLLIY
jgi:hypothetical protein